MTSKQNNKEAYVWFWLPGATEPVVADGLFRVPAAGNNMLIAQFVNLGVPAPTISSDTAGRFDVGFYEVVEAFS